MNFGLDSEQVAVVMRNIRLRTAFQILQWLELQADHGGSSDECSVALGIDRDSISPRMAELERAGCIKKTNLRRPTRQNRMAAVYVLGTADFRQFIVQPKHHKVREGLTEREQAYLRAVNEYITRKSQAKTPQGVKSAVLTLLRDLDAAQKEP